MVDKISFKLIKRLHKRDLPEETVNKILKHSDSNKPNQHLQQLIAEKMVSAHRFSGTPDGEGGWIDGAVKRVYHLEPNGRAEVERVCRNRLKWLIATGIALAAAIGAILSALAK